MSINLSQSFHRTSSNPIDDTLALTKAEMLTVNDNLMPSKYFTICQDDGKLYLYAKSNTPDDTTGRFRVFEGGGSGTTDYEDLENKPSINEVELSGDLSASDLGLATETDLQKKQDQIQYNIIPNASADLEGAVYQYLGVTTPTYTHGHWYECISDGEDPATYSWVEAPNYEEMDDSDMDEIITPLPSYSGGSSNPTGTIISFMGKYAPDGYLACDGSTYNINDYPRLANFFLVQFGSVNNFGGDGTTTFAVPDLRGEFIRGTGTNSHANQGSGAEVGEHQNATKHWMVRSDPNSNFPTPKANTYGTSEYDKLLTSIGNIFIYADDKGNYTAGSQYTSRPTNTSVLFCIKD